MAERINTEEFMKLVESGETFVVDFYADWCGPCQMFLPIFDEKSKNEETKMVKVNIDDDQEAAKFANVQGVPTVIIYKDKKEYEKAVGFMNPEQLDEFIKKAK